MTQNVPNATRQVYLRLNGDPHSPFNWEIFDAATNAVVGCTRMVLDVGFNQYTTATLTLPPSQGGGMELVEVIPAHRAQAPAPPTHGLLDGTELLLPTLEHEPVQGSGFERVRFGVRRFFVDPLDHQIREDSKRELVGAFDVDLSLYAAAKNPAQESRRTLDTLSSNAIHHAIDEMLRTVNGDVLKLSGKHRHLLGGVERIKPSRFSAGGVVSHPGVPVTPGNVAKAIAKATAKGDYERFITGTRGKVVNAQKCAECGGSGEWTSPINNKKSPCKTCTP